MLHSSPDSQYPLPRASWQERNQKTPVCRKPRRARERHFFISHHEVSERGLHGKALQNIGESVPFPFLFGKFHAERGKYLQIFFFHFRFALDCRKIAGTPHAVFRKRLVKVIEFHARVRDAQPEFPILGTPQVLVKKTVFREYLFPQYSRKRIQKLLVKQRLKDIPRRIPVAVVIENARSFSGRGVREVHKVRVARTAV